MKIYILEIAYNDETDEIEYISESLDAPAGVTTEMILECEEYWDEETMEVMRDSYSSGKT
jgi:hypothetical protein